MPRAKRLKSSGEAKARREPEPEAQTATEQPPPTNPIIDEENEFAQLARKYWLKQKKKPTKVKIKNDVLKKEFWDPLLEQKFSHKSLLVLESLQALERYGDGYTLMEYM